MKIALATYCGFHGIIFAPPPKVFLSLQLNIEERAVQIAVFAPRPFIQLLILTIQALVLKTQRIKTINYIFRKVF